jgi:hypothetical protein
MAIDAAYEIEKIFAISDIYVFECANIKLILIPPRKNENFFLLKELNENCSRRFTQISRKFSQRRFVSLFTYTTDLIHLSVFCVNQRLICVNLREILFITQSW